MLLILILTFTIKFSVLNTFMVPSGADPGNWLTMVNMLHRADATGHGLRYPQIFFLLLYLPLRLGLDEFMVLKVAGALASTIIGIPFFLLARRLSGNLAASLCTLLFLFAEGYSEMIAWGGYTRFLGMFFMLLSLYFLVNLLEKPSRKNMFLMSLFLSLNIGTNLLTALFQIFLLTMFSALVFLFQRKAFFHIFKTLLACSAIAFILSLAYLHIYLNILQHIVLPQSLLPFPPSDILFVFRETPPLWLTLFLIGLPSLSALKKRFSKLLLVSFYIVPPIMSLTVVSDTPANPLYFLYIPILLLLSLFPRDASRRIGKMTFHRNPVKPILRTLLTLFTVYITVSLLLSSYARLQNAVQWYHWIEGEELEGLEWIKHNTEPEAVITTSGHERIQAGDTYGWWIQGYCNRKSLIAGDPRWYIFNDEREEMCVANMIFNLDYPIDETYELIRQHEVSHIFLNRERTSECEKFLAHPNLFKIVFENERIIIFLVI